jgi:hypothetical protein
MIRLYKSVQPIGFFILPLITLLLWLPGFMKSPFLKDESSGIVYNVIANGLSYLPQFIQVLLAVGLIVFEAIYLNLLLNKYEVLYKNTYLPSLFYVLAMSFSSQVTFFHPILFVNLLMLFVLNKSFSLFKNEAPESAIFDSCFILSLATLFYFPTVMLFVFFLFSLEFLRTFRIREWLIAIVAFSLPYFFLSVFAFCSNTLTPFISDLRSNLSFHKIHMDPVFTNKLNLFILCFLLIFLFSLVKLRTNFYKNSIKTRGEQQILFTYLILVIGAFFLESGTQYIHFTLAAIPVSTFVAYYYMTPKKRLWLYELSFWVLVVLIVQNHF